MLASMSLVLGDDDLLREILLRVGLPTSLLRAALVCKRWLRHAAEPDFLRRFHARHSPHLLGAYVSTAGGASERPRFLPIHELPRELAPAARRAGSFFDAFRGSSASIRDSLGGRLLVTAFETHYGHSEFTHLVCSPLSSPSSAGNTVVVVPPPQVPIKVSSSKDSIVYYYHEFLPDDGDGRSYSCVLMGYSNQQTTVSLYELQDMHWVLRASAAAQLSVSPPRSRVVLVHDNKFYMLSTINKILVCDFTSSTISAMELPDGVELEEGHTGRIALSRADGSGVYLVHVEESQLRVFHCGNAGSWFLADSICLREVRKNLGMAASPPVEGNGSAAVKIHAVGDNARFVFLEMCHAVVLLDIASKQANKMYQVTPEDRELISVHPLTLKWPPAFPCSADRRNDMIEKRE